ncbi:selenoprotein V-like [Manis pentadactyla]|uniref:selenoprotein V-like n=1 Tax=Manis pentadactyla TaxID=143292 RepID=UPI00255C5742|nr:selenoprotein V-like [Manis pentadactyla]
MNVSNTRDPAGRVELGVRYPLVVAFRFRTRAGEASTAPGRRTGQDPSRVTPGLTTPPGPNPRVQAGADPSPLSGLACGPCPGCDPGQDPDSQPGPHCHPNLELGSDPSHSISPGPGSGSSRSASFGPGAVRASEFFLSPAPPLGLRGEPAPEPILSPDENPAPTPLRETHVPSVVRGFELTQEPFPELTPPPSDLLGRTLVSTPLADPLAPTLMDSTIGPTWTPIGGTVQLPVTLPISTNTLASISKSFQANSRILIRVIW